MDEVWRVLVDTRFEIIKARFRHQEYAEVYALNYNEAYTAYGIDGLKTQILYVQCNLSHWRGDKARETKKLLKYAVDRLDGIMNG